MKYVFFDIDGTIRGKSREITKRNKEAICKLRENGHKAFLCTGRAPVSITQDILDVVNFLLKNRGFITASNFVVDGGMTKKMIYV